VTEPLETLIRYRLERAQESLEDARLLADADRWNACVNRLLRHARGHTAEPAQATRMISASLELPGQFALCSVPFPWRWRDGTISRVRHHV